MTSTPRSGRPTAWALVGLGAGLGLGVLLHGSTQTWVGRTTDVAHLIGQLWVAALQVTVIPLVITQMFAAIVGADIQVQIGRLGAKAIGFFIVMLIVAGCFTLILTPPLLAFYHVDPVTVEAMRSGVTIPSSILASPQGVDATVGQWLIALIPRNLFAAGSGQDILPLLLATVVFGLAVTRLAPDSREALSRPSRALADAMMVIIGWILVITPAGVFALTFELTVRIGGNAAGIMTAFILLVSGLMLLFTGLLYPFTALLGRVSVRQFARAVAPAQLVAVSTRSSLAALPALVDGARRHLELSAAATGFVLPLSVSTYKLNRTISSTAKLLFLAHVFGIPLNPGQVAVFLVTVVFMSFTSVGVPGGGAAFRTLPAYLAAGLPIEGVVILEAADTIPDIFKTLTNVTGDMSAATILSRATRPEASR